MSFATTVGWWAVSSWLPAYTEGLAKVAGEPANVWGPRMGIIYNVGAIIAYVISGFVADAIGRRGFLLVTYAGCIVTSLACVSLDRRARWPSWARVPERVLHPGLRLPLDGDLPRGTVHPGGAGDGGERRVQRRATDRLDLPDHRRADRRLVGRRGRRRP